VLADKSSSLVLSRPTCCLIIHTDEVAARQTLKLPGAHYGSVVLTLTTAVGRCKLCRAADMLTLTCAERRVCARSPASTMQHCTADSPRELKCGNVTGLLTFTAHTTPISFPPAALASRTCLNLLPLVATCQPDGAKYLLDGTKMHKDTGQLSCHGRR
jgi:hypothetical protein